MIEKTFSRDYHVKKVKNFLTEDERTLLANYTVSFHRNNNKFGKWDAGQTKSGVTSNYADPITDALLRAKIKRMNKETNLNCLPTYSFWRCYTWGDELKKHNDRPSCEISVTVHVGSDGTEWPIFIEGNPVELQPGDAVLYMGFDHDHWREKFKGDWYSQIFLHYVNANGRFKEYFMDGREYYGYDGGTTHKNVRCEYIEKVMADPKHKDHAYVKNRLKEDQQKGGV